MSEETLSQLKKARRNLEEELRGSIQAFEHRFGVTIERVVVDQHDMIGVPARTASVRVEVRI